MDFVPLYLTRCKQNLTVILSIFFVANDAIALKCYFVNRMVMYSFTKGWMSYTENIAGHAIVLR